MKTNETKGLLDINLILGQIKISQGQKIAELGSGASGYFTFPLARSVGPEGKVFALDVVKQNLQILEKEKKQRNQNNIETVWTDLEVYRATDLETESVDSALLINTLFQTEEKKEVLKEAYRLLKKSGYLLIVEWENSDSPLGPPAEKRVDSDYLKTVAGKIGLKLEKEFTAGEHHYGLLFSK